MAYGAVAKSVTFWGKKTLLVIDEIQKVPNWSETVKSLWDKAPKALRVILLGSSSLQLQKGLTESLAGRFELIQNPSMDV